MIEEEKNSASNDDDFGLPNFEFEALDDNDELENVSEDALADTESIDVSQNTDIDDLDFNDLDIENIDVDAELDTLDTTDASSDFYEEESFDNFESASANLAENSYSDSSLTFDSEDSGLNLGQNSSTGLNSESSSRTKRQYAGNSQRENTFSDNEIKKSKSRFARIVVLGTIVFIAIGFGFLYWNGTIDFGTQKEAIANNDENVEKDKNSENEESESAKNSAKEADSEEASAKEAGGEEASAKGADGEEASAKGADGDEASAKEADGEEASAKEADGDESDDNNTKPTANKETVAEKSDSEPEDTSEKTTTQPANESQTVNNGFVLTDKTNRYHIIIGSFGSETAALRYAERYSNDGGKVIPPFGGSPNYRVSIASFDTSGEAESNIESYRSRYVKSTWYLKY